MLTRRDFVEALRALADDVGAEFHEVTLLDEKATVIERAERRSEPVGGFGARALRAKQGNSAEETYDRFVEALAARPEAVVIDAASQDAAYTALLEYLG